MGSQRAFKVFLMDGWMDGWMSQHPAANVGMKVCEILHIERPSNMTSTSTYARGRCTLAGAGADFDFAIASPSGFSDLNASAGESAVWVVLPDE